MAEVTGGDGAATSPVPAPAYPAGWEADVVLRDGSTTHVRPIRPSDAEALQAFHVAQSERSTYLRFFANLDRLSDRDLARFTVVDHADRVALVAVTADDVIIGVARYDRIAPDAAEVAFNIADAHHGRGLGSVLLEHLAAAARERGVRRFTAEVLPQNGRMIAVFREAGYAVRQSLEDGVVTVEFDIDPTGRSLAVMADREHRAEARSVQGLLSARSVVVVGSPDVARGSMDDLLTRRVVADLEAGADGDLELHVVALPPEDPDHLDLPGGPGRAPGVATQHWPDVASVPGPVELAVVAVPAAEAVAAVRALARLQVRGVVILSDGFAETGPEGLALQRALLRTAHAAGMRVVGPSSYGVLSSTGGRVLNASLAADPPPPGTIGLFCQSAPMAVALLGSVRRRRLGLSHFVSAGHRADVSGNDLMQFWRDDDATEVVGLYLESIGNPRKFSRVARRLAAVKPVVVVTAGRSGQVVPPGHAVRATRAPRRTLEEVMRQSGVIRVENTHQMLEVAQVLALQPLPTGRRVAIVASSAPMAALVAEAAAAVGLVVGGQAAIVREDAEDEALASTLASLYEDPAVDVVVAVHVPTVGHSQVRVSRALAAVAAGSGRTTVACMLGLHGATDDLTAEDDEGRRWTIPAYTTPEDAVLALGQAERYSAWRSADRGTPVQPAGVDTRAARRLVTARLAGVTPGDAVDLSPAETAELLACAGVAVLESVPVATPDEAVEAAHRIGWPVALKTTVPALRHRADLGGVRLDVHDEAELRADVEQVLALAHGHPLEPGRAPLEVQRMAPLGAACVVRSVEDPLFGPVLSFGLSGDASDLLGDISYAVPPLTDVDVAELVRAARAAPRLFGYRGLPRLDVDALEDVIARLSVLADDLPELRSLELNPVVVSEHGATVLGARAQLGTADRADGSRRALPT
ncbi:GNAT family N-acetyltransferase [Cellulomonas cellasea]|uniref:Acyl-CoA synthetase (NDP forming)/RimJ/RimL family protein N-acetyltransferase n=1 Tax=Cellulomonas cellasea TaxID=43670 RepID=A0A7W4YAB1_9CELL|nr:GNAT family N-acetyltransferase [Cellulomonas cellasea]MBB2921577.1 acyl-CoA synthetase (NDP forming)/RimJ/RimL family protein N-acetyltransferase [Cellulomonas cellasea]